MFCDRIGVLYLFPPTFRSPLVKPVPLYCDRTTCGVCSRSMSSVQLPSPPTAESDQPGELFWQFCFDHVLPQGHLTVFLPFGCKASQVFSMLSPFLSRLAVRRFPSPPLGPQNRSAFHPSGMSQMHHRNKAQSATLSPDHSHSRPSLLVILRLPNGVEDLLVA